MLSSTFIRLITIFFLLFLTSGNSRKKEVNLAMSHVTMGVKIGMLPTGGIHQFALIHKQHGKLVAIQPIEELQMIKIGSGEWPIPRTQKFHDFFSEHGIYINPTEGQEYFDIHSAIESLWKIRYAAHPFNQQKGEGWSNGKFRPSQKQQVYIFNRYGVRGYDQDYFADSSFFQLLKDVIDKDWIDEYKRM